MRKADRASSRAHLCRRRRPLGDRRRSRHAGPGGRANGPRRAHRGHDGNDARDRGRGGRPRRRPGGERGRCARPRGDRGPSLHLAGGQRAGAPEPRTGRAAGAAVAPARRRAAGGAAVVGGDGRRLRSRHRPPRRRLGAPHRRRGADARGAPRRGGGRQLRSAADGGRDRGAHAVRPAPRGRRLGQGRRPRRRARRPARRRPRGGGGAQPRRAGGGLQPAGRPRGRRQEAVALDPRRSPRPLARRRRPRDRRRLGLHLGQQRAWLHPRREALRPPPRSPLRRAGAGLRQPDGLGGGRFGSRRPVDRPFRSRSPGRALLGGRASGRASDRPGGDAGGPAGAGLGRLARQPEGGRSRGRDPFRGGRSARVQRRAQGRGPMMPRRRRLGAPLAAAGLLAALLLPGAARAQAAGDRVSELERRVAALQAQIAALKGEIAALQAKQASEQQAALAELDRKLGVLAEEVEHLKIGEAAATADRSSFGMGPAAAQVYRSGRGVSLGGYGELLYQGFAARDEAGRPANKTDEIDLLRAVVYLGYKFDDRFLFNSEIEFEHTGASDAHAEGDAGIEFAYVDYLARPAVNVRAGLVLLPMGFLNELHEPPTFLGSRRPDVEQLILPTTWRSPGFGLFGGTGSLSYRTYFVNGLDASRFSGDGGISGSNEVLAAKAKANDFAWVGRLDYVGTPGLLAGGSLYTGRSGQGLRTAAGRRLGVPTTLAEAHAEWKWRGLRLRALGVRGTLGDTADLNAALGLSGGAA